MIGLVKAVKKLMKMRPQRMTGIISFIKCGKLLMS